MPSSGHSSYPKGCLKRPSVFPVVHADLSEYDHAYDLSSSSMRDWDSLFMPNLPTTSGGSTGCDSRSILSTASSTDPGSSRPRTKSVSFCDVNDVHLYTPEPLPPERPRGVVTRFLQACAYALRLEPSSLFSQADAEHTLDDEDEN